jgi:hypothetical protein
LNGQNKYFIRGENVSLKYGMHKSGPYNTLKQIVESLISADISHSVINPTTKNIKLYLLKWINMDEFKEFRVFVHNKKITAISQQNCYQINRLLENKTNLEIELIVHNWIGIITDFFEFEIVDKIVGSNYSMDIVLLNDDKPYFIEINSFGKEYAAGSALFTWVDEKGENNDIMYGKMSGVYFRYTCSK